MGMLDTILNVIDKFIISCYIGTLGSFEISDKITHG